MSRDSRLLLEDILRSAQRAQRYVEGLSFEEFIDDSKTYDAVLRNLQVIGDAAKSLAPEVKAHAPGIDWRGMAGLRDITVHAYFAVDPSIIWDVVSNRLEELREAVQSILDAGT